jgi:hypothetical protein
VRFILRGQVLNLEKEDIAKAVRGSTPGVVRKYGVTLNGREYPIKQAVGAATGLPNAEFTAHDAYRILKKLGYDIKIYND